ncbi:MAG: lysophospholipid acyltransferase family protein [Chitinophagaceae bacterium]
MYYIVFGILYAISLLPFAVLYLLADFFYFITYYVIGYRKEVVFKNLLIAFPEKTGAERKKIAKAFYHHFWDNWIEALKLLSISEKGIRARITADLAVMDTIYLSGRSCHVLLGHQFNWEWGNAVVTLQGPYTLIAAYSPLSNKIFDRLFLYLRRRFGTVLLPFNDMRRGMLPYRNRQYLLALMADQSPSAPGKNYWLNFFNTRTAFLRGPEKGARLGNMPVIFVALSKLRRGYYHLEASLLTDNAGQLAEEELTRKYVRELEANIRRNPALYLWSHKRWKHGWKEEYYPIANKDLTFPKF